MTRPRSESMERPMVDYNRPLGISHRRQSTGSTHEHRSEWTRENLQRHEATNAQRGRSNDRGRGRSNSAARSVRTNNDAKSIYSASTVSARSRSRERPRQSIQGNRYEPRNRNNEQPYRSLDCNGCGKRHPGGQQNCQFIIQDHPDANRNAIAWRECITFQRLQKISQSIKSLEYNRRLKEVERDVWALVDTRQGPRKPEKYGRVSSDEIIVLPDSQINEIIDLNVLFSEHEDSKEDQARKYEEKIKSETAKPYTKIDKNKLSLLLDSGCIGRDFISSTCVEKLNLHKYDIMYPIEVTSIHGNETATEVVYINNFEINYKDQKIIIPEINLVVINKAPTDVILGHGSLKKHNVYGRLSRYFGTAHSDVEDLAVRESCR